MGDGVNVPPEIPEYDILECVGTGGMSVVWKAREKATGEICAIKVLNSNLTTNIEDVSHFYDEERTMERLSHPGVVKSRKLVNSGRLWYFVMEFVDGYNFGQLLARKQHLGESDCLLICQSVASALDYAWNEHGIVHCDIKPENIMVNSSGEIKITDLGLCHTFKFLQDGRIKAEDHVFGTPAYISPEQVYGDVEPDCRADIYSLAATLYHLSTGRLLFPHMDADATMRAHCDEKMQAKDPREYRPALSRGFCQLLEAMLVKNRDYRIANWADVFNLALDVEKSIAFKPRETSAPSSLALTA